MSKLHNKIFESKWKSALYITSLLVIIAILIGTGSYVRSSQNIWFMLLFILIEVIIQLSISFLGYSLWKSHVDINNVLNVLDLVAPYVPSTKVSKVNLDSDTTYINFSEVYLGNTSYCKNNTLFDIRLFMDKIIDRKGLLVQVVSESSPRCVVILDDITMSVFNILLSEQNKQAFIDKYSTSIIKSDGHKAWVDITPLLQEINYVLEHYNHPKLCVVYTKNPNGRSSYRCICGIEK